MKKPNLLQRLARGLTRTRNFVLNSLFLLLLFFLIFAGIGSLTGVEVPENAALVLNPKGQLVEETSSENPLESLWDPSPAIAQASINDLVRTVDAAAADERIRLIVLDLDELASATGAHVQYLGEALGRFRDAGKEVVAYGHFYNQGQYAVASFADAVYLHPFGQLLFFGYGRFLTYFKGLLDKFDVNAHVFQAGEHKEAAEPFTQEAMSSSAREINQAMVDELWEAYRQIVIINRELDPTAFDRYANAFDAVLEGTGGDMARAALEYGLVDELMTPDHIRERIAGMVDDDIEGDYPRINYLRYLETLAPEPLAERNLGLIYASGIIEMGDNRAAAAADNLVELIRQAREDDSVAAIVLRINSPGGDPLASELIRQELELAQLADKPVVASLGPVAASGGYWVASTANQIVAHPTTLTGSIGVFGLVLTFDETLANVGIQTDGVGSLPLSGGLHPLLAMNDPMQRVVRTNVDGIYQRFVHLVAKGRGMTPEAVDEIAQGRVWLGQRALEIGLVDGLGDLPDALEAAAEIAAIGDDYGVITFSTPVPPTELLLQMVLDSQTLQRKAAGLQPLPPQLRQAWAVLRNLKASAGVYALCEPCLSMYLGAAPPG